MNEGFFTRVYNTVRLIPSGKVTTYGRVAALAGNPHMSRQVGWALHQNPYPGEVPCHRVVNRLGECSGSFAFGGLYAQRHLLEKEGILFNENGRIDLKKYLWEQP